MPSKTIKRTVTIEEYRASPRMEVRIPRHVYDQIKFIFGNGKNGGYRLVSEALTLPLRTAMRLIYNTPPSDGLKTQNIWVKAPPDLIAKASRAYVTPHTFVRAACVSIINKMTEEEKLELRAISEQSTWGWGSRAGSPASQPEQDDGEASPAEQEAPD